MLDEQKLKQIGHNIKIERVRADLTQEELAEKLSINAKHLGAIERGTVNLKILTLLAILEVLNVPFEVLYPSSK